MNTKNMYALTLAVALSSLGFAQAAEMSKSAYKAGNEKIEADYKVAKFACKAQKGNANDICVAEAKGVMTVGKADLYASHRPSEGSQYKASVTKADATFAIAKERCDDAAGNAKDVCRKEAKAAHISTKADAKAKYEVDRANMKATLGSAKVRATATKERTEARQDASTDKRDAEYAVEKEKCDAMAGAAKDTCIAQAKVRFGKS